MGLAELFQSIGYRVLILGKLPENLIGKKLEHNGIVCRDIRKPDEHANCSSYAFSAQPIAYAVALVGAGNVKAVVAYNYPARGAYRLIRFCHTHGIAPVLDITEWHAWEGTRVMRNIWRQSGVHVRIFALSRLANNIICASSWFARRVRNQNSLILPFALNTEEMRWNRREQSKASGRPHFVYSGSPGVGMKKDRLPVMLSAFARLAREGHEFIVSIAGISRGQFSGELNERNILVDRLGERVRFLGRITHSESLELLRSADFSVFFRKPDRMTNTGFPTKYVEAATLGIPVITNPTSDISKYLRDGENGIFAASFSSCDIEDALRRAVTMSVEERAKMLANCRNEDPFDLRKWRGVTKDFMKTLRTSNE